MTKGQRVLMWIAGIGGMFFGISLVDHTTRSSEFIIPTIVVFGASIFVLYKAMSKRE